MRTTRARFFWEIATAIALLAAVLLPGPEASAKDSWGVFNYEISDGTSDTGDFIDQTSFRGIGFEGRWFTSRNMSMGYSFDWNVLHEKTGDAITVGNVTLSGTQDRTINTFPILVTGHYYMGPDNRFFAGLGGGFYYEEQRFDIGVFAFDSEMWHLGVAPEIGISHEIDYDVRAVLALRYNYGFEASDSTLQYWTLKFGIAW
jgi:outer membrane protein